MEDNRFKVSSCYKEPICPGEQLDMGHFRITVKKQFNAIFMQNLVIDMILLYSGGQEDLAFIPAAERFIEGRENIIKALKERII